MNNISSITLLSFQKHQMFLSSPLTTIFQLSNDVLYIVANYLDIPSTVALRATCRNFYHRLPSSVIFSELSVPTNMTNVQLEKFASSSNNLRYVRKVIVKGGSSIQVNSLLRILKRSPVQQISIVGCENFSIPELMSTLAEWLRDKSGNSPTMSSFKKFIFSRCIGGPRNALAIKRANQDLESIKQARGDESFIYTLTECDNKDCHQCKLRCGSCHIQYNFCDMVWVDCIWCKKKSFCGPCVTKASLSETAKPIPFQYIKICTIFDLSCT
ncbi:13306_t:CDS:1 [Ambispora gerdemannii]|uniref:13306_t:CDS:1 n=1 Tax=Ambispora gerdemannii TaxID=144530 RepID=A0A9N8W6R9_9GLOM|nr:13306_t:CDS:1 [Ambispora gerdemannii]